MNYWYVIYFDENGKVWEVDHFSDDQHIEYLATIEKAKQNEYTIQYGYF